MKLTPEEAVEFGQKLVGFYSQDYEKLVESSDSYGFTADLKDENMRISLSCASNGEAHRIFFSFVPEERNLHTYYELDLFCDNRYNDYCDLICNAYEIFQECDEGLQRKIDSMLKKKAWCDTV